MRGFVCKRLQRVAVAREVARLGIADAPSVERVRLLQMCHPDEVETSLMQWARRLGLQEASEQGGGPLVVGLLSFGPPWLALARLGVVKGMCPPELERL